MWKNIIEGGRPQPTIWRMRIAVLIPKAIDTHSQYVILIGSPLQQLLRESAQLLRYMYIGLSCLNSIVTTIIVLFRSFWLVTRLKVV